MTKSDEEINQIVHEARGKCWHDLVDLGRPCDCDTCSFLKDIEVGG